ncbi:MAG: hypothetical protein MI741_10365 [Rhodospirillales bacterium]|nr:hypothetical protein [Rhodospirillales bacterium]
MMASETEYPADDLLQEFLAEAGKWLDAADADRAQFKQTPLDRVLQKPLLDLFHTAKGASAFLPLPRLELVATASAALADGIYDGRIEPEPGIVMLVCSALDRLRELVDAVSTTGEEPPGDDSVLIGAINAILTGSLPPSALPRSVLYPSESDVKARIEPEPQAQSEGETRQLEDDAAESGPVPEPAADRESQPGAVFLLFRREGSLYAIDSFYVEWLDLVDRAPGQWTGGTAEIPYQGAELRLVGGEDLMARKPEGPWPLIVLTRDGERAGLIVDEIMNVVADPSESPDSANGPAEVIDVSPLFD